MIKSWLILSLVAITIHSFAQEDWELKRFKDGIKVYTRDVEGSGFKAFRGEVEFPATISSIVSVLKDIEDMKSWGYKTISSRMLEMQGDTVQIYYVESKAPWPVSNRDGIYYNRFEWVDRENRLIVHIKCLSGYLEEVPGLVRIPYSEGQWDVALDDLGTAYVTFTLHADPGGSIPAWLINSFSLNTPFETLQNLRIASSLKKYQDKHYDFLEGRD